MANYNNKGASSKSSGAGCKHPATAKDGKANGSQVQSQLSNVFGYAEKNGMVPKDGKK